MPSVHFIVPGIPRAHRAHSAAPYKEHVRQEAPRHIEEPLTRRDVVLTLRHFYTSRNLLDLDNLQKTIFDALKGVAYRDDSQIVRVTAERYNISITYEGEDLTEEEIEALVQGGDFLSITVSTRS